MSAENEVGTIGGDALVELVHQMPAGILIWNSEGVVDPFEMRLVFVNRTAASLLGVDANGVLGGRLADLAPNLTPDEAATALALSRTGGVSHLRDATYHLPGRAPMLCQSMIIGLGADRVATRFEDVTADRAREQHRHAQLRGLVAIGDEERRRLAMRLHDDVIQRIAAAAVVVDGVRRHARHPEERGRLESAALAVRSAAEQLRLLQFDLSPPELAESDLQSAVRSAVDLSALAGDLDVELHVDLAVEPDDTTRTAAVRILVEALTNVRLHAAARRVDVAVTGTREVLTVSVADDGKGMLASQVMGGHGLVALIERAEALGGSCAVDGRPGVGTTVSARLPMVYESAELVSPADPPPAPAEGDHRPAGWGYCEHP